jgi:hypothetical protein
MYETPLNRQKADRDEQQRKVNGIVASMTVKFPKKAPRIRVVWNECLQKYVGLR